MYSELFVKVITGKEDSDKVWRTLERSHGGELLELIDVVSIGRDDQGRAAFQMRWKASDQSINHQYRLAAPFAEALFGSSSADLRLRLTEAGLDSFFLQEVAKALKPGRKVYLIHVSRESQIDTRRYVEILGRLEGDLYHTTFQPQVEEVILKQKG